MSSAAYWHTAQYFHDCSVKPRFSRNMLNGPSQPTIQIGRGQPRAFEADVWSLVLHRIIEHDLHISFPKHEQPNKKGSTWAASCAKKAHLLGNFRAQLVTWTGSTGAHGSWTILWKCPKETENLLEATFSGRISFCNGGGGTRGLLCNFTKPYSKISRKCMQILSLV